MPRKPNYKFERMERERNKAAKKAARLAAKKEKAEMNKPDDPERVAAEQADSEEVTAEK